MKVYVVHKISVINSRMKAAILYLAFIALLSNNIVINCTS